MAHLHIQSENELDSFSSIFEEFSLQKMLLILKRFL